MPIKKKIPSSSKAAARLSKKSTMSRVKIACLNTVKRLIRIRLIKNIIAGSRDLLQRRPHRSFKRTYRRDYVRSLKLPGYWSFSLSVNSVLWKNKKLFSSVLLIYIVLTVLLISFASEDSYMQLRDALDNAGDGAFNGFWGELNKAGLLLAAGAAGAFNSAKLELGGQGQIYTVLIGLLIWLTTVWLLRAILSGGHPRMRDGIYQAGAPIVSTIVVGAVLLAQLLPIVGAIYAYNAAIVSGLLDGGIEAMLFWAVASLLVLISLYWVTATLIALVVVTLPGVYPVQALRTAGDLVIGRRVRILLRLLWMAGMVIFAWILIMIPIILFDGWIKSAWEAIWWLPLVPASLLIGGAATVIWIASYIYLLYRKIVDDDALPA
jgi:hypothetical protein